MSEQEFNNIDSIVREMADAFEINVENLQLLMAAIQARVLKGIVNFL